ETFMLPVEWENEFPIILRKGKPVPTVVDKNNLQPEENFLTGNFEYNQAFDDSVLDYSWMHIRTPKEDFYSIKEGKLHISPLPVSIQEQKSPAAVLRRQQHTQFAIETQLEYSPGSENDFAGLTLFQNEKYQFLYGKTFVDGKQKLLLYRIEQEKD